MAFIDLSKNEIQAKIVYYGPGARGEDDKSSALA